MPWTEYGPAALDQWKIPWSLSHALIRRLTAFSGVAATSRRCQFIVQIGDGFHRLLQAVGQFQFEISFVLLSIKMPD